MNFLSAYSSSNDIDTITIPKSSLGYGSNNLYSLFPPLMTDGRSIVSTTQSETIINHDLLKTTGVKTNWDYRNFMTKNATQIYEVNKTNAYNDVGYYERMYNNPTAAGGPGGQRGDDLISSKRNGDLKQKYLSREELNARIYSPNAVFMP